MLGLLLWVTSAQAALGPVINGQVYDDVQGISWLQDANLFKTLCDAEADINTPTNAILVSYNGMTPAQNAAIVCANDGRLNWFDAEKFIAALNANGHLGVNTWRQPGVLQPDATCEKLLLNENLPDWPEQRGGYNCRAVGSELSHLFNTAPPAGLGNPNDAGTGATGGTVGTGCGPNCFTQTGPFTNTQYWYWSGTEFAPISALAWSFYADSGNQDYIDKAHYGFGSVWPVHPGQAAAPSAVPALSFWGLGLMGLLLAGLARRRLR